MRPACTPLRRGLGWNHPPREDASIDWLLILTVAVLIVPVTVHGRKGEPSRAPPGPPAIPSLHTPSTITSSGQVFIARCDNQAFAKTRYPQNLAERCERLLKRWRWEANVLAHRKPEGPRIPNYADAHRSSPMAQAPMGFGL